MTTNISAYKFAPLADLKVLREQLYQECRGWGLKGTILLSTEGINLFVAGERMGIDQLLMRLRSVPGLESLEGKFSESDDQPFTRMLVKIKKEIIAFGVEGIDPARQPSPRLSARELKQWLDEGRSFTLLDTRNDFEVRLGTFQRAVAIGIDRFRDFPQAARKLEGISEPIVTFCTGGIRCEKAAPFLERLGLANVYQLDGGILKYFEECGNEHFEGECFVFDKRVGLSADLHESGHGFCHACQSILTPEDLDDPRTVEGISCPRCYLSPEDQKQRERAEHQTQIESATNPLPGSAPADNYRPLKIGARHDRWTMIDFLCDVFRQYTKEFWLEYFEAGDIVDLHCEPIMPSQVVRGGERYYTRERLQVEPSINPRIEILDEDEALIVINKPAPLPTHPSGRFHRNTLEWILRKAYTPQKPRPAHRLDANTTGVIVFTRTASIARLVQPQFEKGEVQKVYLARVIGHPPTDTFSCDSSIGAAGGRSGARMIAHESGQPSLTNFQVLERFKDDTSLLLVEPRTGRTNQIRVHLWHLGFPIVGDAMYKPGHQLGDVQTSDVDGEPLCLHAWRLTLTHPLCRQPVTYEAPKPSWVE